jgi:hypothetical protein
MNTEKVKITIMKNYNPQYIQNADFRERPLLLNYDTSHNKKKNPML